MSGSLIPCVGAVIKDERGRLLLIRRGHDPGAGLWSLPGGRVEPGETDAEALVREMREETGLVVQAGRLLGSVRRPYRDGDVVDIRDYVATVIGGTLNAGDDAADIRWVDEEDFARLPVTEGLAQILASWGVLGPRAPARLSTDRPVRGPGPRQAGLFRPAVMGPTWQILDPEFPPWLSLALFMSSRWVSFSGLSARAPRAPPT